MHASTTRGTQADFALICDLCDSSFPGSFDMTQSKHNVLAHLESHGHMELLQYGRPKNIICTLCDSYMSMSRDIGKSFRSSLSHLYSNKHHNNVLQCTGNNGNETNSERFQDNGHRKYQHQNNWRNNRSQRCYFAPTHDNGARFRNNAHANGGRVWSNGQNNGSRQFENSHSRYHQDFRVQNNGQNRNRNVNQNHWSNNRFHYSEYNSQPRRNGPNENQHANGTVTDRAQNIFQNHELNRNQFENRFQNHEQNRNQFENRFQNREQNRNQFENRFQNHEQNRNQFDNRFQNHEQNRNQFENRFQNHEQIRNQPVNRFQNRERNRNQQFENRFQNRQQNRNQSENRFQNREQNRNQSENRFQNREQNRNQSGNRQSRSVPPAQLNYDNDPLNSGLNETQSQNSRNDYRTQNDDSVTDTGMDSFSRFGALRNRLGTLDDIREYLRNISDGSSSAEDDDDNDDDFRRYHALPRSPFQHIQYNWFQSDQQSDNQFRNNRFRIGHGILNNRQSYDQSGNLCQNTKKNVRASRNETTKPVVRDCVICIDSVGRDDAYILNCGHGFHLACISEWLQKGLENCPVCRSDQRHEVLKLGLIYSVV